MANFVKTQKHIANYFQKGYYNGGADIASESESWSSCGTTKRAEPCNSHNNQNGDLESQYHHTDDKQAMLWDNARRAYALIYNQCSFALKTNLRGQDGFSDIERNQNVIGMQV